MTANDLYSTLGVRRTASYDEIRTAYRQLARVLHPDRQAHRSEQETVLAERRIREVNEAWTVLSDTTRRQEYDYELERIERNERVRRATESGQPQRPNQPNSGSGYSARRPPQSEPEPEFIPGREYRFDGTPISPSNPGHYDYLDDEMTTTQAFILRRTPWLIVAVVLFVIFVMTAYVRNDSESAPDAPRHDCVRMLEDRSATPVSCDIENDGRIVAEVNLALDCPAGSRYVIVNDRMLCATTG